MQRVFSAMSVLLPEASRDGGFTRAENRAELSAAFATLRGAAVELRGHSSSRDASFGLHARNLADDALLASSAFALGDAEEARFTFTLMTQRCIDCHSRLPDLEDSALAERLIALPDVKALAPLERARFDVALRRFNDALTVWEAQFADPASKPGELDREGTLADYLTIAIRVKADAARPRAALETFAKRADVPAYLHTRLIAWLVSLDRVGARIAQSTPSIRDARELAMMARNLSDVPTARDGLVFDLAASSVLLRWIDAREKGDRAAQDLELAAAYYELGVIEDRTAYSVWLPETDAYMEAAVRAAPSGPHARRAYARVEEQLLTEIGAASPENLPEAEQARLAALRALIDGTGPPASSHSPLPR